MSGPFFAKGDAHDLLERIPRLAALVGAAGMGVWIFGALFGTPAFRSYLVAFLFWNGISLGSLSIILLHHIVGGAWGLLIRRPMEAAAMVLPLLAVLFIPIAVGLDQLYPWAWPLTTKDMPHLGHKLEYLNRGFFLTRALIYFVVWGGLAWIVGLASRAQDRTEDQAISRRLASLSPPALIAVFLTGTFMAIDWGMSLEPDWSSTMYPPMVIVGQGLETFAVMIAVAAYLADRPGLSRVVTPGRFQDLGNLLLAFVMLWAYMSYSQFLIIWSGNLREEIPWYIRRVYGGWQIVAIALILFHFFGPFLALLMRATKRTPRYLAVVALAVVAFHYVDLYFLVKPASAWPQRNAVSILWSLSWFWTDIAAFAGIGGFWVAAFTWLLRQAPLVPVNDPTMLALADDHGHHHEVLEESGHVHPEGA